MSSADVFCSLPNSVVRVEDQIAALARVHAIVAEAFGRMRDAAAAGQDTLASIQRLRLENAVDLCRIWVRELRESTAAAEQVSMDIRVRLHEMQTAFRAFLQSASGDISEMPRRTESAASRHRLSL